MRSIRMWIHHIRIDVLNIRHLSIKVDWKTDYIEFIQIQLFYRCKFIHLISDLKELSTV